jgi:hypothetical protein
MPERCPAGLGVTPSALNAGSKPLLQQILALRYQVGVVLRHLFEVLCSVLIAIALGVGGVLAADLDPPGWRGTPR